MDNSIMKRIYSAFQRTNPSGYLTKKNTNRSTFVLEDRCCFWHGIRCPQNDGGDIPVLPYQRTLYEALQNHKHIWCLKSRGIGVTSFLLRYIAWCCLSGSISKIERRSDNELPRACFIVGPRIDLAEDLIARFKGLFTRKFSQNNDRTSSTVTYLNGVRVEAFPSHHVDTMRGLTDVKIILSDESSYYPTIPSKGRTCSDGRLYRKA
jgi:hypothetical protein